MKDRVSKYPGRVKMMPVEGQTNTFDMVRADEPEQEGTPLNKNAFLTDDVAALYGLDGNATPNKAFMVLSGVVGADFVNKNVWVVTEYTPAGKTVSLGVEDNAFLDSKTEDEIVSGSVLSATVFRTKNVVANADGTISAENVSSVVVTADSDVLSGYFWSKNNVFTSSNTYYTPEGETTTVSEYGPGETTFTLSVAAQSVSVVDTEEKTGTASVRYGSAGQYPNCGFVEDFAAYPYAGYKYQGYGLFKNIPLYIGSGTGGGGGVPVPGEPGATFVPSVSAKGVISWTNDGGLANPEPVDLVAAVLAALPKAEEASF